MASLIYNSTLTDEATGAIDYDSDAFKVMLVIADYDVSRAHRRRSDITNEASGDGYTAGGLDATVEVTEDEVNNRTNITLGAATWPVSTITAAGAVYYKSRGGDPAADELVAFIDFSGTVSSHNAAFTLTDSTIRKQN